MPTHRGIRCTIRINDTSLKEYQDDEDESPRISVAKPAYVAAVGATAFSIQCEILPSYNTSIADRLSFCVHIDGKEMAHVSTGPLNSGRTCTIEGAYGKDASGTKFVHPFRFSRVSLVEDHEADSPRVDPSLVSKMGEISVFALRTRLVEAQKPSGHQPHESPDVESPPSEMSEKTLKGKDLTHITKFGPKKLVLNKSVVIQNLDSIEDPFVHFRFLYRSKRALNNLRLVPHGSLKPRSPATVIPPEIKTEASTERISKEPSVDGMFRENSPPEIKEEEPNERLSKEPSIDEMSREDMAQEILRLRAQLEAKDEELKIKLEAKEEEGEKVRVRDIKPKTKRGNKVEVGEEGPNLKRRKSSKFK